MTAVSGAAAYQQLRVPQDSIDNNNSQAANRAAQKGNQQRALNAQQAKDNAKAKAKALDETKLPDDAFKTTITGFDSRDDVARSFATKSTDGYTNAGRLAREAYERGDQAEYRRQLDNQKKIMSQFKNFTNNEGHLAELNKQWVTMGKEGKISPVDDKWEQFMEAQANHNFEYKLDEDNNPYVQMLMKDEEGNERVENIKVSELVNGNYRPYEAVDVSGKGGLVDEMLVGFGKRKYDVETGGMIVTNQVWDDKNQKSLDAKIDILTGDKRTMSSLLYQASGATVKKMGDVDRNGEGDEYTEEDKALVADWISSQVKGQYDETISSKVKGLTAEEKLRENARNRSLKRKGQEDAMHRHHDNLALGRERLAKQNSKLSKKEQEASIRRYDISQAVENKDVQSFSSGSFEYEGKDHTASNAQVINDKMVITTTKNKKITIPLEERALNDLYNSYEGKTLGYDDVMSVPPNQYRVERKGKEAPLKEVLTDPKSGFWTDDDKALKELQSIYGDKTVKNDWKFLGNNHIKVKGVTIDIDDDDYAEQIETAINGGNNNKKDLRTKYKY